MTVGVWALLACAPALVVGCNSDPVNEVVVYVAVDRRHAEPILKQFEEESGVRVRAVYDAEAAKTTGLVNRLLAESGRPQCDVFWNNEIVQTLQLADRGLLAAYESPAAKDIPQQFKDPQHRWTAIATRARVIVYNTHHVPSEEVPQSIFELTEPRWKGKVAIANPQFGTTRTHVAALYAVLGRQRAEQYLRDLLANDVRIVDGNAMVKNLVAHADLRAAPILVGLTDADDVLAGQSEGEPVAMIWPDQQGIGTLHTPTTVCLLEGGPHPAAARQLVDFLCGPGIEKRLTEPGTGYDPVRPAPDRPAPPRRMQIEPQKLLEQLEPSTRFTREKFQ
jgi:iron(III) transport system substrate-binding protein